MNCVQPVPDCLDQQIMQDDYYHLNKTSQDCWNDREKFIAARVYLAVAIFNAIAILATTGVFIYLANSGHDTAKNTTMNLNNTTKLHQLWKKHSLKQRSVMGTALGAIGHLIFSTCLLLGQALNAIIGCELQLWSVCIGFYTWMFAYCIRAYQLKFMFRLNQLKVKYLRMNTSDRLSCIKEKDYQWYIAHKRKVKKSLMKPYMLYAITLAIILAIAIPLELHVSRSQNGCQVKRGAGLLIGLFGSFILILVPFILWYLKDNADAHGIRQELWIDAILGIPLFITYILLFFLLQPEALINQGADYKPFKPGIMVIVFTSLAHFMAVVVPIIGYLPIENKSWVKMKNLVSKSCSLQHKRPSGASDCLRVDSTISKEDTTNHTTLVVMGETLVPELSVESLERSMMDPEMMRQLQDLAIRDFSSENLLFYEKYLELEAKFKQEIVRPESNTSKNWLHSYISSVRKSTTSSSTLSNIPSKELDKEQITEKFLSTPIPYKLYPSFKRFYETYIAGK